MTILEKIYRSEITKPETSLARLIKKGDKNGIVKYFLKDVISIAKKYRDDVRGMEFMDIVGAGNEALVSYASTSNIKDFNRYVQRLRLEIEEGIREYVLKENLDRTRVSYDESKLIRKTINPIEKLEKEHDAHILRERINKKLRSKNSIEKDFLTEKQGLVIDMIYGLGYFREGSSCKKIAEAFECTRSNIDQNEKRAYYNIRRSQALMEDLYAYLETISDKMLNKTAILNPFTLEEAIKRLSKEISELKGKTLNEFKAHFGLSGRRLAKYLTNLEPMLQEEGRSIKLVELIEKEKEGILQERLADFERYKDLEAMKQTLERLERRKQDLTRIERIGLEDQIREAYMPLYCRNREKCLEMIAEESINPNNPTQLRKLFTKIKTYFEDIAKTEILGIKTTLDDFQKVDLDIMSQKRAYIIASDMGTGKSLEAIAYAVKHGLDKILIISTKSGANVTWPNELRKHLDRRPKIVVLQGDKIKEISRTNEEERYWYVTTYASAFRHVETLNKLGLEYIVLDESHHINNPNSQTSRGIAMLDAMHKTAMSGFLFKNSRKELFPLLNWLYPEDFSDPESFDEDYCRTNEGLQLLRYELGRRMILRFKEDVIRLPPIESHKEVIKMSDSQRRQYADLEENFLSWFKKISSRIQEKRVLELVFHKLHSLRRKTVEFKMPAIKELINSTIEGERKSVLYTTYLEMVKKFRKEFSTLNPLYIIGQSQNKERIQSVSEFEGNDERKLFIISKAGGESLDLTPASIMVYANKPLTYADEKQALDRVHRRRQKRKVDVYHLVVEDTVDERIENLLESKRKEYKEVVQEASGLERWFEEDEKSNIRQLVEGILAKSKL